MTWWTSEPVIFTKDDLEGHRVRFLVAEKRARIATRIGGRDDFPAHLEEVNPEQRFPILTDKNLVCYGPALDELIHERYPSPTLLPVDPVKRAQVRMLTMRVRARYNLPDREDFMAEVQDVYNDCPLQFFMGHVLSTVDIALAPMLYDALQFGSFEPKGEFKHYADRLLSRPTFAQSLRSSTPVSPEEALNDEAA